MLWAPINGSLILGSAKYYHTYDYDWSIWLRGRTILGICVLFARGVAGEDSALLLLGFP